MWYNIIVPEPSTMFYVTCDVTLNTNPKFKK